MVTVHALDSLGTVKYVVEPLIILIYVTCVLAGVSNIAFELREEMSHGFNMSS